MIAPSQLSMMLFSKMPRACRSAIVIATALLLITGIVALVFQLTTSRMPQSTAQVGSHAELIGKLNELESGLNHSLTPEELTQFASVIKDEITKRPLPMPDEFQFGADLLLRELRTLAALQNHHDLKVAKGEWPALDAQGSMEAEPDGAQKKCRGRLARRITNLKELLSKLETPGRTTTPLSESF